jgi:hypothetical protein
MRVQKSNRIPIFDFTTPVIAVNSSSRSTNYGSKLRDFSRRKQFYHSQP